MINLKHWKLETDDNGILWCHLDQQGASANVLSAEVLGEFGEIITVVEQEPPRGMIILSDKANGFIAGADVEEFTHIQDRDQALVVIRQVHAMFNRLESLSCPTLALINGYCLGGGLELALACRYRVALDDPATRVGLPEVLLGIHPGFGGTVRLIRLLGAPAALPLMLAGKTVDARKARKLGLVDRAVPIRQFRNAALALVLHPPRPRRPGLLPRLANVSFARNLLAGYLRRQLQRRINRKHYPAPYSLVNLWQRYGGDLKQMLDMEGNSVADLIVTDTSRNLVRIFMLQERLKAAGKDSDFKPQRVHVIGAGVMGGDIAAWCVLQGFTVTLQDRAPEYIAPAIQRAYALFKRRFKAQHLVTAAMDRLVPDPRGSGVARADVVIEAIIENLEAKAQLFREVEARAAATAVIATNTSSIPLDDISRHLEHPERLVGIHFFNPVARMQLVEIVYTDRTGVAWCNRAAAFCRRIDRLPVPVRSSPGFLVNRILTPYLLEAVALLEEGVPGTAVDTAAVAFGMPMGPVELADSVGLDICLSVAENLSAKLDIRIPEQLRQMVADGRLGRKTGRGFYQYRRGKAVNKGDAAIAADTADLEDRLILRIINECVACLREGIVADADQLDAAMVFGTGFAPFRGGPMKYLREQGREAVLERLIALEVRYGDRFRPDAGWDQMTAPDV